MSALRNAWKSRPPVFARAAETSVADHLQRMAPSLRAIARATRRAVRAAAPAARERAYKNEPPRSRSALWKIARYALGDADVVGIGTSSVHVLLYFYRGVELDDGAGLLEGSGKVMRSIRMTSPQDAARPEVRRLLHRAFQLAAERPS